MKYVEEVVCRYCGYAWIPKVKDPKACPRCHRRTDSPYNIREEKKRDVEKRVANQEINRRKVIKQLKEKKPIMEKVPEKKKPSWYKTY